MTMISDLGDKIWFTADHHFGHENIIKFCERPFADVREMDRVMVERWNKIIKPDDTVYHLGDFTLLEGFMAEQYFNMLNGNIKILSNPWHHDKRWIENWHKYGPFPIYHPVVTIELLPPMHVLEIPELGKGGRPLPIVLCHYPLAEWDRKHHGAWHLHGHSHGKYKHQGDGYIIDVGVDTWNFHPLSLGGVLEIMYGMGWM